MDPRNKPLQRIASFADPAVGANLVITPNTAAGWLFRTIRFRLVTSTVAGFRTVTLQLSKGATEYLRTVATAAQGASADLIYCGIPGSSNGSTDDGVAMVDYPNDGIWVNQGHTLTVGVVGIDGGDQISEAAAEIWEFPTGPLTHFWPFIPVIEEESS